jgi:hypothetical protein
MLAYNVVTDVTPGPLTAPCTPRALALVGRALTGYPPDNTRFVAAAHSVSNTRSHTVPVRRNVWAPDRSRELARMQR